MQQAIFLIPEKTQCCGYDAKKNHDEQKTDLYWRGVRERLRALGLLDTERDLDLGCGDGLRRTLAWRDGTDLAGVPVFDWTGDFSTCGVGNGIDIRSRSESESDSESLVSFLARSTGDLSGLCLRSTSAELRRALAEASELTDLERLIRFSASSLDETELSRLLLLAALF